MFELSKNKLKQIGAAITTQEIKQQPDLWKETIDRLMQSQENLALFFDQIKKKQTEEEYVLFLRVQERLNILGIRSYPI